MEQVTQDIIFCLAALLGQILHAVKKWADGEADNPWNWLRTNPKRTVSALIGNAIAMFYFVTSGALTGMTGTSLIVFGVMQGVATDSALNKGARNVWTATKRQLQTVRR